MVGVSTMSDLNIVFDLNSYIFLDRYGRRRRVILSPQGEGSAPLALSRQANRPVILATKDSYHEALWQENLKRELATEERRKTQIDSKSSIQLANHDLRSSAQIWGKGSSVPP